MYYTKRSKTRYIGTLKDWLKANRLKLNEDKTQTLTFSKASTGQTACFLGLFLDDKLNWNHHITTLCSRLSSALYTIRKIKAVSTWQAAKITYFANFHSIATYGVMNWGMAAGADRVFILQKRAVRILFGLQRSDSCRDYFRQARILTIASAYILACVKFTHNNLSRFKLNSNFHNYPTRTRNALATPLHRLSTTQQAIDYWGPKLYNHLPDEIKHHNTKRFTTCVKKLLFENAVYSVQEYLSRKFV